MKRFAQPIEVITQQEQPAAFRWRDRDYRVLELLDQWRICTRWWVREEDRHYFQVLARPEAAAADPAADGVYELCRRGEQWRLERLVD